MKSNLICVFLGIFLLVSCATVVSPGGGEKDITPPRMVSAKPEMASLNFSGNSFKIQFDEFITKENFEDKILVSPQIKSLESKYTGKGIIMSWDEELLPNSTYNFQFLNTIKDYNEGNVAAGFQYTFSTGDILDSLSVYGKIQNSTFDEVENVRVCLISEMNYTDSSYLKSQFDYVTFAKPNGDFAFNYLPEDTYRVYSYSDKNSNEIWDENEDFIGFFPHKVNSSDSLGCKIELFKEDIDQKFNRARHIGYNRVELDYQKSIPQFDSLLFFAGSRPEDYSVYQDKEQVVLFFNENIEEDSLTILVNKDTLPLFKSQFFKPKIKLIKGYSNLVKNESALFISNYPLSAIDTSKIKMVLGLDSLINCPVSLQADNYTIAVDFSAIESSFNILFGDSSLIYSDSLFNDKEQFAVSRTKLEELAIVQCSFKAHEFPLIVELFSSDHVLIESKYLNPGENKTSFKRLPTGKYKLRYIVDSDEDGLFTSGSVKKKTQPESMVNYTKEISLKPNWITEIVF